MSKDLERSLKDRVKEIAKAERRAFNDVWKALILERFLVRLARSANLEKMIFKGGFLLSKYLDIGRETTDLDFSLTNIVGSIDSVRDLIRSIMDVPCDDGFSFQDLEIEEMTHPHMNYAGYEVTALALLGGTRTSIRIDLGVGDRVTPERKSLLLLTLNNKPLFESEISIQVYPLSYIFAEKLEAVVYRGGTNSRMKDFYDLLVLRKMSEFNVSAASVVIRSVFSDLGTAIPNRLSFDNQAIATMSRGWKRFVDVIDEKFKNEVPLDFSEVLLKINEILGALN